MPDARNAGSNMACNDYVYSPRGRGGLGVIQPQSGLDYPFIAPSEDVRYLIADFYYAYDDPGLYDSAIPETKHPIQIKWLYGIGCEESSPAANTPTPTHSADIILIDANNRVVFDSTTATHFASKSWGADYKIYEWRTNIDVCRLVAYTTWSPDEAAVRTYPLHLNPVSAVLDERAVYKMPKRVKSIKVLTTKLTNVANVDLICGYNIGTETIPNTERGFRRTNEITIAAEPGLGAGRYSDCTDKPPDIVLLNGVTGPDVIITASDCLWTKIDTVFNADQTALVVQKTQPTDPVNFATGTVKTEIGSHCPACCDCEDYVNTARYMNCVRDRYALIGNKAHDVLLQHTDNIARWVEQRECRIKKPLKIIMTPQLCPFIDVVIQYCNLCETCAEDVNVVVNFEVYPGGGLVSIEHCYTVLSSGRARNFPYYIPQIGVNSFEINFGKVSAGNSADILFRIAVSPDRPSTVSATVTGTKKQSEQTIPITEGCLATNTTALATTTAALSCDNNGNTITVC